MYLHLSETFLNNNWYTCYTTVSRKQLLSRFQKKKKKKNLLTVLEDNVVWRKTTVTAFWNCTSLPNVKFLNTSAK